MRKGERDRDALRKGRAGQREDEAGGKEWGYSMTWEKREEKRRNEGGVENKRRNILGG